VSSSPLPISAHSTKNSLVHNLASVSSGVVSEKDDNVSRSDVVWLAYNICDGFYTSKVKTTIVLLCAVEYYCSYKQVLLVY
jgi:hypothetical protein